MNVQDELHQLLEARVRAMLQEDINKKAKQSCDVIQRSRAAIEEQFNLINKEIDSVINKRSEYAAFLNSKAMPAEVAEFEFAQAVKPLLESISGEWIWKSKHLQLCVSWMLRAWVPQSRTPPSNPPQPTERQGGPEHANRHKHDDPCSTGSQERPTSNKIFKSFERTSDPAARGKERANHEKELKKKQRQGQNPTEVPCNDILVNAQLYDGVASRNADPEKNYTEPPGFASSTTLTERNAFTGPSQAASFIGVRDGSMHRNAATWPSHSFSPFTDSISRSVNAEQGSNHEYALGSLQAASWSHSGHDHTRNYSNGIAGYGNGEEGGRQKGDTGEDYDDDLIFIRENFIGPTIQAADPDSYKTARDIKPDPGS
ncbi:uncharacterized protein PG986_011746 [Apiospora aurea]|uniref:Uncharacterized protein n=1 Tax=Apiospora aurea TaxID=335848 RepID=A0ABR1PY23_9PEZI